MPLAQSACDSDSNCKGVYDEYCDNSAPFNLCLMSAGLEASIYGSCVYEKTAGIYHFNSCCSGVKFKTFLWYQYSNKLQHILNPVTTTTFITTSLTPTTSTTPNTTMTPGTVCSKNSLDVLLLIRPKIL